MKQKYNIGQVITYAGAFIALLIGSGFATGQEILQFFSSYRLYGLIGIMICFGLFTFAGLSFLNDGYYSKFEKPNQIYKLMCGNKIGAVVDYYAVFFIFLSYTVMIAGAQATAVQHFNAPKYVGGAIMAAVVILVVMLGLGKIVDVIGKIGPVIAIMAIVIGLISIFMNMGNLQSSLDLIEKLVNSGEIKVASKNFFLSAGSYVGFNMIWLVAFLAEVGNTAKSLKDAEAGVFIGSTGFSVAIFIMSIAIILSIPDLYDSQIPVLVLAGKIHPVLATIFSIFIMLGIFTTSVPLLWTVTGRFFDEGTKKYKLFTLIAGIVGAIIGLTLKFDSLVNIVYVVNGYIGMVLLAWMIIRSATGKAKKQRMEAAQRNNIEFED
ncbi:hypothetical protein CJ208_09150 [Finegoldia magna]|uniref:Membrane protein YkvI n=1 Tax=Finegoldia magna TaxID=1260 RepID=A0A2N6SQH4_FINMA|nr:hypothetical protein [Finegoldia magna]MBS5965805.1 hypothetical protein [Finegoldia magna]MDU1400272.1 hypothetical protein [Finegoldia magna]MDU7385870.1 hypothetical protein [Finegoldia magna]OXZ26028.1 hypothetical protein B9N52_02100 [Finegoldia magna]PMC59314.1 hypothetical protein CJ208_09150 [Finegoldia magna]